MKKFVFLLLLIPVLAFPQRSYRGTSGVTLGRMLSIISDSTMWHKKGSTPDTILVDGGLPIRVTGLKVTGNTTLDGNLTMNTIATEQVKLGTGSDAAPELSSVGDTNTGLRIPGSDVVTVVTNSAEQLRVTADSVRNENTLRQKGIAQFGATATMATIATNGKITAMDGVIEDSLVVRDASDADSIRIYDSGSLAIIKSDNPMSFIVNGTTASAYTDFYNNSNSGHIAVGRTDGTEASSVAITDGGSDNLPGYLSLYEDDGNGTYIWVNTASVLRGRNSSFTDDDADGYAIMDLSNGTIGATTQAVNGSDITATNKVVVNDSLRVEETSLFKGIITAKANTSVFDSLNVYREKSNFADDDSLSFTTGVAGWGSIMAGDAEQWCDFTFKADGTVTLKSNSAKVSKTYGAGDDSLMVYDGGSGIRIKNRLGAAKKIAININYFTP